MTSIRGRCGAAVASLACLAALAACGDRVENTQMPQPAHPSVEINRQGMEGANDAHEGVGVQNKGDKAARVGYVGSLGAKGDTSVLDPDVLIAEQVKAALASQPDLGSSPLEVRSREGEVTLVGRAPDPAARERATTIARSVPKVRAVDNQLTLG